MIVFACNTKGNNVRKASLPKKTMLEKEKTLVTSIFMGIFQQYFLTCFNPFPNDKILDWPKMNEFAEDNFEFN